MLDSGVVDPSIVGVSTAKAEGEVIVGHVGALARVAAMTIEIDSDGDSPAPFFVFRAYV
jgi:hypothetical protein